MPGCKGCAKTAHGGVTRDLIAETEPGDRYEVRDPAGDVIGSFTSAVAAATFMRGHPRTTLHTKRPA